MGWIKQTRIVNGPYLLIYFGLLGLSILVQLGALVVASALSLNPPRWIGLANVFVLPLLVPPFLLAIRRRTFIAILRAHDGRVCTSCGYPLNAEHDGKPCPECGTPIDLALYRTQWIQALGGWKESPKP